MHIILGSQSPRRRELMAGLDIPFDSVVIDADESFPAGLRGGDIPVHICRSKAEAYLPRLREDDLLITADTIVWLPDDADGGVMLGKPRDEEDACGMLRALSGRVHQVYTGVTFALHETMCRPVATEDGTQTVQIGKRRLYTLVDRTDVTFRKLSEDEIRHYVNRYRPLDKAGAYGVQEWIGYVGVTGINGSYFNVMGLPVERVYEFLETNYAIISRIRRQMFSTVKPSFSSST